MTLFRLQRNGMISYGLRRSSGALSVSPSRFAAFQFVDVDAVLADSGPERIETPPELLPDVGEALEHLASRRHDLFGEGLEAPNQFFMQESHVVIDLANFRGQAIEPLLDPLEAPVDLLESVIGAGLPVLAPIEALVRLCLPVVDSGLPSFDSIEAFIRHACFLVRDGPSTALRVGPTALRADDDTSSAGRMEEQSSCHAKLGVIFDRPIERCRNGDRSTVTGLQKPQPGLRVQAA